MGTSSKGRTYRLISGDSHVNEPPDLWVDRVPAALRDRAPADRALRRGRRVGASKASTTRSTSA